jgi:hypothetical protein
MRTISTPEELAALPELAVVLDASRMAWQHIEDFDFGPLHWRNSYNEIRDEVRLPATVLSPVAKQDAGATIRERDLLLKFMGAVPPHVNFEAALWGATTALILARDTAAPDA